MKKKKKLLLKTQSPCTVKDCMGPQTFFPPAPPNSAFLGKKKKKLAARPQSRNRKAKTQEGGRRGLPRPDSTSPRSVGSPPACRPQKGGNVTEKVKKVAGKKSVPQLSQKTNGEGRVLQSWTSKTLSSGEQNFRMNGRAEENWKNQPVRREGAPASSSKSSYRS